MIDKSPSIAVVDDDKSVLKALCRLLKARDLRPHAFISGDEFLDSLHDSNFSCVLLDIWMPGLDGFVVARRLAGNCECIPIIFMTAHDTESNRLCAAECGASDYLVKPASEKQILSAIHMAINPTH